MRLVRSFLFSFFVSFLLFLAGSNLPILFELSFAYSRIRSRFRPRVGRRTQCSAKEKARHCEKDAASARLSGVDVWGVVLITIYHDPAYAQILTHSREQYFAVCACIHLFLRVRISSIIDVFA
jgi:hypothetical protein